MPLFKTSILLPFLFLNCFECISGDGELKSLKNMSLLPLSVKHFIS